MGRGSLDAKGANEIAELPGGEAACWAHLVCLECGALTTEGHREGCRHVVDARLDDDRSGP